MALASTCVFAALDELRPWVKVPATSPDHDAVLEALCNDVSEQIERWTGRIFVQRAITETLDGCDELLQVWLKGYPVTTPLTTFTVDGVAVASTDYVVDTTAGIIRLKYGRLSDATPANVVVAYTAGFTRGAGGTLPETVRQLAREMVRLRYADWCAGGDVAAALSMGGQSYTPRSTWPYHVKDGLDALRNEVRVGGVA